jgi:hypothetical protein
MQPFNLLVFGPSDGAVAFSFPGCKRVHDDSLFLASSTFNLTEGNSILRLSRHENGEKKIARVGLYRQIYEPQMSRLGQSFGVIFEFNSSISPGNLVIQTIEKVISLVEAHCTTGRQFCSHQRFVSFLNEEIDSSVLGISETLNREGTNKILKSWIPTERTKLVFRRSSLVSQSVAALIDWFYCSAAGTAFEDILIASETSGSAGASYLACSDDSSGNTVALNIFYNNYLSLNQASLSTASLYARANTEIANLREEISKYRELNSGLSKQLEGALRYGSTTNQQVSGLKANHPNGHGGSKKPPHQHNPGRLFPNSPRTEGVTIENSATSGTFGFGLISKANPTRRQSRRDSFEKDDDLQQKTPFLDTTFGFSITVVAVLIFCGLVISAGYYLIHN